MKKLHFEISINASAKRVWSIMTNLDTYKKWTGVAFPGSTFEGEWKKGAHMRFIGPDGSGTLAEFVDLIPEKLVRAVHQAILLKDGVEDRESDLAKGWIGSTEDYTLTETGGITRMENDIVCPPDWASMHSEAWPKMLLKLKELCEK